MSEPRTDEEWAEFYADQQGVYDAFAESLEHLLRTLLDEEGIDYGWVSWFSRSPNTFAYDLSRARRAGQVFDNPLESPLRVAGVTVIVETATPLPEIVELVGREFAIDVAASVSIDEAAERNDRLGRADGSGGLAYEYPHFLVSLDERRRELAEWSRFAGLYVRVEVKTVLQDAWETIDLDCPSTRQGRIRGKCATFWPGSRSACRRSMRIWPRQRMRSRVSSSSTRSRSPRVSSSSR